MSAKNQLEQLIINFQKNYRFVPAR